MSGFSLLILLHLSCRVLIASVDMCQPFSQTDFRSVDARAQEGLGIDSRLVILQIGLDDSIVRFPLVSLPNLVQDAMLIFSKENARNLPAPNHLAPARTSYHADQVRSLSHRAYDNCGPSRRDRVYSFVPSLRDRVFDNCVPNLLTGQLCQ